MRLIGVVYWLAALVDLHAQQAPPRMPLSPPLPPFPIVHRLHASAGTNQAARLAPQITAGPLPQLGSLLAATNRAIGPAQRGARVPISGVVQMPQTSPLVWDAQVKEYFAEAGETNAQFTFSVTNSGPTELLINDVRTSCGCVVATLPECPWRLAPGTNGQVQLIADLRGKRGLLHKLVHVYTADHGIQSLAIKVYIADAMEK